jgi:hypothetical protein
MDTLNQIIVALGGASVIAVATASGCFVLFRLLGEKWMSSKFDEKLAAYKHEQQKELEQLKFKITGLLDRATKLHQREFDILPEAWTRLVEAYYNVIATTSALQTYPDLDRMSSLQLD